MQITTSNEYEQTVPLIATRQQHAHPPVEYRARLGLHVQHIRSDDPNAVAPNFDGDSALCTVFHELLRHVYRELLHSNETELSFNALTGLCRM